LALAPLLALLALLTACAETGSGTASGPVGTPPAYNHADGQIIVQLFPSPGQLFPPVSGTPEWTLYGDGTLIYRVAQPPDNTIGLLTAHLAPAEVDRILEVVVNRDAFFGSTRAQYGTFPSDAGFTLLTVNTASTNKQVMLGQDPGSSPDSQTTNVFSIASFLRSYRPNHPAPYAAGRLALPVFHPPPSASGEGGDRAWPYDDIKLADAAARACAYLPHGYPCAAPAGGTSSLVAVYGSRVGELLRLLGTSQRGRFEQDGDDFMVVAFPVLP